MVGWDFIASSPRCRKNFVSNGDLIPSIILDAASPRLQRRSRRTSLASPLLVELELPSPLVHEEKGGVEEGRRSRAQAGAPAALPSMPTPHYPHPPPCRRHQQYRRRRSGGVELKWESSPLCLRRRRPTTPIPLHAGGGSSPAVGDEEGGPTYSICRRHSLAPFLITVETSSNFW
jgi:hypothetical protein